MYLTRLVIPGFDSESTVKRLLNQADLDFLQLDCVGPPICRSERAHEARSHNNCSSEFLKCMRAVHRSMFLHPQLRVVTDGGGDDVVGFMESLAEFLVEHGSGEMPIAAVRGDNVLPELHEFWPESREVDLSLVLAAQAVMGAGPLATALGDGARFVVAGAYDSTAPFIAAALSTKACGWHDQEKLARLAAASQFEGFLAEFSADGHVELEQGAAEEVNRVRELRTVEHSDLKCDYSSVQLEPTLQRTQRITNVRADPCPGMWNVRVVVSRGYRASILVSTTHDGAGGIRTLVSTLTSTSKVTISEYIACPPSNDPQERLLKLECEDDSLTRCQGFADSLQLGIMRNLLGSIIAPWPSIESLSETFITRIPADRIVLSVDTRPASEWL